MQTGLVAKEARTLYPINTATVHIENTCSCACSGDESSFALILVTPLSQSKAVSVSHPKPIIPLFHTIVTVISKWLYIQPMAICS